MFESLVQTWEEMLRTGEHGQRLIDHHPLRLYFGSDAGSRPLFFLITASKPQIPEMSSAVTVDRGERHDGSWTIVLTLQDKLLAPAFIGMCLEMVRRSANVTDESLALSQFFSALNQLRSLLDLKPKHRLSLEQLRGLAAEVWFATHVLFDSSAPSDVLVAWQGPYGAPQDFRLASGQMFEVKALHAGARAFDVSSVEQLDPTTKGTLALAAVVLEDASSATSGTFTLLTVLETFRTALIGDRKSLEGLDHRLSALGVETNDDFYANHHFIVSGVRFFDVTNEFPRLLREDVPLALENVTYRVRLAGISQLEVGRDVVGLGKREVKA
ncbi:hypothetical protein L1277_001103 [Okibacterium sp. HSC-33S16]|uniref:PD-(D/E)XK motif protein n=1 Tax=Okibacterium sp. HSC-33S16 TaxID=2910965 RepID=UPI0020A1649E|nr:PD-(D/E)XK motif protein [Okibacterium sp. HSC-33S16]MCP2031012.1 hypothetical protein [Okibacterium sp. HSC-33S16]